MRKKVLLTLESRNLAATDLIELTLRDSISIEDESARVDLVHVHKFLDEVHSHVFQLDNLRKAM